MVPAISHTTHASHFAPYDSRAHRKTQTHRHQKAALQTVPPIQVHPHTYVEAATQVIPYLTTPIEGKGKGNTKQKNPITTLRAPS